MHFSALPVSSHGAASRWRFFACAPTGSDEDSVDRKAPAPDRGLGVGYLSRAKHGRLIWGCRRVSPDRLGLGVDVPYDLGTSLEVIGAFGCHLGLGRVAVISLAADLDRERRRPKSELHVVQGERT